MENLGDLKLMNKSVETCWVASYAGLRTKLSDTGAAALDAFDNLYHVGNIDLDLDLVLTGSSFSGVSQTLNIVTCD